MGMCRFESSNDPNYCRVAGELRSIYSSLVSVNEGEIQQRMATGGSIDLHQGCLESLGFPEMNTRKTAIASPTERTCTWLLDNDVFNTWLYRKDMEKHEGLLWIEGKPGSGKSTILKEVSRRVIGQLVPEGCCLATFFFNAKGTELERNKLGMLRSLLFQILRYRFKHLERLAAIYEKKKKTEQFSVSKCGV